ncbi:MAG: efflux RND transporter periplasmic adaptor subunit [Sphingobacteriales bacterium]|nr:efflux RND transporter periplasmic adaptor subunit [Sphingobacteriales bacterium]
MNAYIKPFLVLLLCLSAASCGNNPAEATGDNKSGQLEALKKQQADLNQQISSLEKELGVSSANDAGAAKQSSIEVTDLHPQSFVSYLEVQGSVEAADNIGVSPRQPGIIEQVSVIEGQSVSKGQLLATLDDALFQQSIQELQTNLEFARTIYAKQKSLWDKQIGTEVQYLTAKNNVETLEKKLATLREQGELYKIYAPISGIIDQVNVKNGEGAMVGMPVFRIVNMKDLSVKADIAENYAAKIKQGAAVEVYFPDIQKNVSGKITRVSNVINGITRSFEVEVKIPAMAEVRPNMIAMLKVKDYAANAAIVVPVNTLQTSDDKSYVMVAEKQADGSYLAKRRMVETGTIYGNGAEVKKGLQSGDLLISTGYQDLANGQAVKF